MVGILLSFWEGLFSGAMLVLGRGKKKNIFQQKRFLGVLECNPTLNHLTGFPSVPWPPKASSRSSSSLMASPERPRRYRRDLALPLAAGTLASRGRENLRKAREKKMVFEESQNGTLLTSYLESSKGLCGFCWLFHPIFLGHLESA